MQLRLVYYLEVTSSWCFWAEPAWAELRSRYGDRVDFAWKIARTDPADFPISREQCEWYYRRSGTLMRSPVKLNPGWFEPGRAGHYPAPNLVAEAARDFRPPQDDTVRLALSHAAVIAGRKIGDMGEAVAVAASAGSLDPQTLRRRAESPEIAARVAASTAEFHLHQVTQRPTFILTDEIGDKAVFSGLATAAPLAAAVDAMLADTAGYAAHAAQHGKQPPA